MKLLQPIGAILRGWTDSVAAAVIAAFDRMSSPRVIRLIEQDNGGFAVESAGKSENMPQRLAFADGSRKMTLAGAGSTYQHDVVSRFGERRLGQLHHQLAIHRRDLELEPCKVPVCGELRGAHLVADRPRGPLGRLGAQQLLDQPA